ncbi:MAG TPA: orotidine-5'-phosphate decarboxylase [Rectinemataceae bacterium]|nr:orotidine-5'-phosphate decarboxylase [Rectinemataceae bacterium]
MTTTDEGQQKRTNREGAHDMSDGAASARDGAASAVAMDRLYAAVEARGPVCVGLDTALDYLPAKVRSAFPSPAEAILAYNAALIEATADYAACFKVQIAYYEELGLEGLAAYAKTLQLVRSRGMVVIADIKRGDIADTASRYARAHFSGDFEADCVTLNPYMGLDSIEPWLEEAEKRGKGLFGLVRTSNPGMRDFEALELAKGGRVYDEVGRRFAALAGRGRGLQGYGALGAVVGCTEREEAASLRSRLAGVFILIPGYGAQGGAADDAALLLERGNGGIVNASRSILKAWSAAGLATEDTDLEAAASAAREAARHMRDAIRDSVASAAKLGGPGGSLEGGPQASGPSGAGPR